MAERRRKAPSVEPDRSCAALRWVGRVGNKLTATAPSRSRPGAAHTITVHLVTDAVTCDCTGHTTHKHCWHVAAAREGAMRYNDTLEVLRACPTPFLEDQARLLAPSQLGGVVALAWLAAKRVLWERQSTAQAA